MKYFTSSKRKLVSGIIAGILACSFVLAPVTQTLTINNTAANGLTVNDPVNLVQNTITAGEVTKTAIQATISTVWQSLISSFTEALSIKELTLDGIAWALVNVMLEEMIRSTTQWVNSGFQGSPMFVTDLGGFMTDLADKVAGQVIWGSELDFLCAPFRLNIQLALEIQYNAGMRFETQCRLSQIDDNINAFLDGNFASGGWDGWFQMAMVPQNNPYGAMFNAQRFLNASIESALGKELRIRDWGKGFPGLRECEISNIDMYGRAQEKCVDVTPGTVIENQLNSTLDTGRQRLTIADEINELVGALLGQLVGQVMGGAGGLLGTTNSNYGRGDYFDRMEAEQMRLPGGGGQSAIATFNSVITSETEYRNNTRAILNRLTDARNYKNSTYGTSTTCATGRLTDSLETKRATAQVRIASSSEIIADVQELKADMQTLLNEDAPEATFRSLWTKYNAQSTPQAQSKLMNEFMTIRSSGILHSPGESTRLEVEVLPQVRKEIKEFTDSIDDACKIGSRIIPRGTTIASTTATST